jgi:hypothetical protein
MPKRHPAFTEEFTKIGVMILNPSALPSKPQYHRWHASRYSQARNMILFKDNKPNIGGTV